MTTPRLGEAVTIIINMMKELLHFAPKKILRHKLANVARDPYLAMDAKPEYYLRLVHVSREQKSLNRDNIQFCSPSKHLRIFEYNLNNCETKTFQQILDECVKESQ